MVINGTGIIMNGILIEYCWKIPEPNGQKTGKIVLNVIEKNGEWGSIRCHVWLPKDKLQLISTNIATFVMEQYIYMVLYSYILVKTPTIQELETWKVKSTND